jgi:cytochrome c553
MWHHFWDATDARHAAIAGDLAGVKAALTKLSTEDQSAEIQESWGEWMSEMQEAAKVGAQATTLPDAAAAIAKVGTTCADCHRATGGGPNFGDDYPGYQPRGEKGLSERMARHVYSEEELWLGMSGPVHPAWSRGAAALMNIEVPKLVTHTGEVANEEQAPTGDGQLAPGAKPEPASDEGKPDTEEGGAAVTEQGADLDVALQELRALGSKADATAIPKDKEAVYAEILSRCGSCHSHLGIKLGPQG